MVTQEEALGEMLEICQQCQQNHTANISAIHLHDHIARCMEMTLKRTKLEIQIV
jgi:hypothetical protein